MEKKIRFIILALLIILATAFLINLYTFSAKSALERERNELRKENETLTKKIEESGKEKRQLQEKIDLLTGNLDKLSQEKESIGTAKEAIQKQYELAAKEKDEFTDKLNSIKYENEALKEQLKNLSVTKEELERKFAQLQKEKSALSDKLSQLEKNKESIELPPIVVRSQPESAPLPAQQENKQAQIKGKVLAINKDNNFVIIDLGEDSGVKAAETFKVYRQEEPIAAIEVIEIRKNIAACDIKQETSPIEVGDTVK